MTETIVAPKIIKKVVKTKSFRLFDFHIYDEFPHEIENGSGSESENDSNDGKHKPREKRQFVIQMFGINELGKTCCLYVMDYQPFFYVKVGDHWTNQTVRDLQNELVNRAEYHGKSIIEVVLEKHKKLYGFTSGKSYNFVKIVFQNSAAMNKVKNIWYGEKNGERVRVPFVFKNTTLELYESNIPPLLRYFHINNISPSGWIQILLHRVQTPKSKTTTCDFEYICTLTSIQPIPQKETPVPYKICSFDIEASSSHGDFPVPIKSYKRLATNLVDVFKNTICSVTDTVQRTEHLKQMIHAAFGFGNYTDIDLVYPKYRPNEKELNKLFQIFLKMTIQNAKKTNTEENIRILTIDSLFEKHSEMEQGEGGGDGSDDDEPENIPKSYGKSARSVGVESTITILDILTHTSYDREQRIQFTNETLMSVFPKLEGDKVTFIGSTFMRYGDSLPYMNHCLVLGSCDEVEGAVIETTETESDLLLNWTKLIQKENPDIIIGYNIFGFDYEFMFRRAQENRCEREFLTLSRKRKEICAKVDKDSNECFIENTKVVLASGEYDLRYYKTSGRLQIDMYTYFRRDFNLPSYKLDDVAGQYISDDVKKVEFVTDNDGAMFTYLYTNNIAGLHVGNFIHIEISSFTSDYYRDGHKFVVIDIQPSTDSVSKYTISIEGHETDLHDHKKSIKWCMAKDDVSPQDIFRLSNGSASDRAKVAKYCIQDCNLVHHLMNKIDVITGYVEMSRICSVPISFLVFRGQGIKLTSFVAKKCREKGTLMPDLEKSGENDGYEGAIVLPPKCSMYMDNPVACVDYSSLYPSSMISNNLSQDSKVWTKEYDLKGKLVKTTGEMDEQGNYIYDNLPEYQYVDVEFDTFRYVRKTPTSRAEKVKSGTKMCRWAQLPNNQKSIMPSILEELLKARSDTRKMIKTEKDPFMQNILDKRQLGYKVTANSLYGQCGARTSTFYEQDVAASTTATGRLMITYAKRIIEEVYQDREYLTEKHGTVLTKAEYIYGDSVTDYTPILIKYTSKSNNQLIDRVTEIKNLNKIADFTWQPCKEIGKQDKEVCELNNGFNVCVWSEKGWTRIQRIIRHKLAPNKKIIRISTPTGIVDVTDDHSLLKPDGIEISPKNIQIGEELLHHKLPNVIERKGLKGISKEMTFSDQHNAMVWFYQLTNLGYLIEIDYDILSDNQTTYILRMVDEILYPNSVKKMCEIPYEGYVYDLTTENHHFAAGIGNMIVHNTDSVFFTFNLQDPKTGQPIRGKDALEITIEIAQDAAHLCTEYLKPPMELTYEKTLMPFVLLSKKRYVGMLYETDANKGKLKYMGLSLKRRDSCDYLKDVYGEILNILMKENNIQKAIEYLDNALNDLIDSKVPMEKLMITRALRSDYKNPQQIAHKVLADRIGQRDPGNKPKPGDRIKFVFTQSNVLHKKTLMGNRIETPEFIKDNKLKIDYTHYITNQLMKPLQQLFGLAIEKIWEYQRKPGAIKTFKKDLAQLEKEFASDYELFMKRKEKYCSAKVKILLFDKILNKIANEKNGIQMITSFYK